MAAFSGIMSNQQSENVAAPFYSLLLIIALYLRSLSIPYSLHSLVRKNSIVHI